VTLMRETQESNSLLAVQVERDGGFAGLPASAFGSTSKHMNMRNPPDGGNAHAMD